MNSNRYLMHYGVKGMHLGERRWQYTNGSLTPAGRIHYDVGPPRERHSTQLQKARFNSPEKLMTSMKSIKYSEFNRLMTPDQVRKSRKGSCHDQVIYELDELKKQGLKPKAKFIMAVDDSGQGGETHSFVYYTKNGKTYWIENAWDDKKGIHEFDSEDSLIREVGDSFSNRNKGQKIYIADFDSSKHKPGEDLGTFVDIAMNDADEYNNSNSDSAKTFSIRKKIQDSKDRVQKIVEESVVNRNRDQLGEMAEKGITSGKDYDVVSSGASFQRLADKGETLDSRRKYVSILEGDNRQYMRDYNQIGIKHVQSAMKYELTATKDIKVAKGSEVAKYILSEVGNKRLEKAYEYYEKYNGVEDIDTKGRPVLDKILINRIQGKWETYADDVNNFFNNKLYRNKKLNDSIINHFKELGYDAIVDVEDS